MTGPTFPDLRGLDGYWLGRRRYAPTFELMEQVLEARRSGRIGDVVLLLEHEPVITLGRGAHAENILASRTELEALGVDVVPTGRGGDVTVHAPGQLVAYPIVDLSPDRRDVRKYVQLLSRVMAGIVRPHGIDGGTIADFIGLWVDAASPSSWPGEAHAEHPVKIGAIGVRISRWFTSHGFALNLAPDLALFQLIVPCGIKEHGVTSARTWQASAPLPNEAASVAHALLAAELGRARGHYEDLAEMEMDALLGRILARSRALAHEPLVDEPAV